MSEKLIQHPKALCNIVRRIALEAGEITLRYYDDQGFEGQDIKKDGSPVTIADKEAEKFITQNLLETAPSIPVIGEEAVAEGRAPDIKGAEYYWLVDALDGTKEFIKGGEHYTVNIALIHQAKPVLGVVYAPACGLLYAAHGPETAIRWSEETEIDKPISVRKAPKEGLTVVASSSHGNNEELQSYLESYKVQKTVKRASSFKLCTLACGKADLYPRFGPTCFWDIAAGHAVLNGAGGDVIGFESKQSLIYSPDSQDFLNPYFVAFGDTSLSCS